MWECELGLCLLIKPHLGPGRPRQRPSARDLLPPLHPQARPPEPEPAACRSRNCDAQAEPAGDSLGLRSVHDKRNEDRGEETEHPEPRIRQSPAAHVFPALPSALHRAL